MVDHDNGLIYGIPKGFRFDRVFFFVDSENEPEILATKREFNGVCVGKSAEQIELDRIESIEFCSNQELF